MTSELENIIDNIIENENFVTITKEKLLNLLHYFYNYRITYFESIHQDFFKDETKLNLFYFLNNLKKFNIIKENKFEYQYTLTEFGIDIIANKCMECGSYLKLESTDYYCNKCSNGNSTTS